MKRNIKLENKLTKECTKILREDELYRPTFKINGQAFYIGHTSKHISTIRSATGPADGNN